MSKDCVSSAEDRVKEKPKAKNTVNAEPKIVFIDCVVVSDGKSFSKIRDIALLFRRSSKPTGRYPFVRPE
jgi:phage antirepressor YoqD-like protein